MCRKECNKTKKAVKLSVDNGHSYFCLQLWWRLRKHIALSMLLVFTPTFIAIYIACSRITDYWHHYEDVIVGSLLGIAGAFISFNTYSQKLHEWSGYVVDCNKCNTENNQQDKSAGYGATKNKNADVLPFSPTGNNVAHRNQITDFAI
eukprot:36840_1